MMTEKEWKEHAGRVGIRSGEAWKHLFMHHTHPLADYGDETSMVPTDVAIQAIIIAEQELGKRKEALIQLIQEAEDWGEYDLENKLLEEE